jgi:hypothetical protein
MMAQISLRPQGRLDGNCGAAAKHDLEHRFQERRVHAGRMRCIARSR